MDKTDLINKILAILFFKGEEVSFNYLAKKLNIPQAEIRGLIDELKEKIENLSLTLVENENKILLAIKPEYSNLIEELKHQEQAGELSPAALETLSIILYKGPLTKIEIDTIRGVNSVHSLRNLLVRGLIDRVKRNENIYYQESLDLLRYLGISKKEELPQYEEIRKKLTEIEENYLENWSNQEEKEKTE